METDSPHPTPDDELLRVGGPHTVLATLIREGKVPSVNELVAYNMTRARRERGWTQQEVAERLQRYTGRPWSNASISAAERSWQGGRSRKFDANELVALSVIFDFPVAYFLLPPDDQTVPAVLMAQPEDMDQAKFPVLPNRTLIRRVLMDRSPSKDDSEFFYRAQTVVRRHMDGDEWHPPVFLSPDMVNTLRTIPVETLTQEPSQPSQGPIGTSQDVELVPPGDLAKAVGEHVRRAVIDQSAGIALSIIQSLNEQGMLVIKPTGDPKPLSGSDEE